VFTWHNHRFPNPTQLHSDLAKEGFKSVVILDPGVKIEKGYKVYDEGVENELFVKYPDGSLYEGQVWPGWCHFPDFTLEKTRNWWANKIKDLADAGVSGFWNDMNEPAVWGKNFPDITRFDMDGNSASHKMAHNIYGMQMARSTAQGAAQHLPNKRPFVLTRAAFAGSQRYAAIWTGDNYSSSDHLLLGTLLVNNLGLSGYAFAGNDVGGFIGECSTNLFIRWIQVGAFTPLFRVHSMINSRSAEPWSFGEEAEEIARNYIKFRYAILPYIYTAFYEHSQSGMPISRSLLIDYYADKNIFKQEFQYEFLFGSALLICAVLPDKNLHKVYLPESMWYDFFTDTKFQGSKEHILELPMEKLPVFVKEGSFIPMQEPGNHTAHIVSDVLALHFYHCKHSTSYTYYEDEGDGFGYNQGVFVRYAISFSAEENAIHIAKIEGNYQSRFTRIKLYLHGFEKLGTIKVNGKIASINTSDFSFMAPISDFDPFSKRENNNMQIKNLPYIEFAFENQININVEK
jgi:alpha-glucosidase